MEKDKHEDDDDDEEEVEFDRSKQDEQYEHRLDMSYRNRYGIVICYAHLKRMLNFHCRLSPDSARNRTETGTGPTSAVGYMCGNLSRYT